MSKANESNARAASIGDKAGFANMVHALWKPIVGVGLYCSLTTFAVQYPAHIPIWAFQQPYLSALLSVFPSAVYMLTFFVVGLMFARRKAVPKGRRYLAGAAMSASAGIAFNLLTYTLDADLGALRTVLFYLGGLLTGTGTALLGVEWMRSLAARGPLKTLVCMATSSFIVAVIFVSLDVLPAYVTLCFAVLFPWASTACLDYPESKQAQLFRYGVNVRVSVPWKLVFAIFIQGLSAGIIQSTIDGRLPLGYLETEAIGVAFAALTALAAVLLFRLDFNQLLYEIGFPVMALGYLVLIALGPTALEGILVHEVGSRFIMIMTWALAAWIISQNELSANWVYPCVMCSYLAGRQVGVIAGSFDALSTAAPFALMIFVILMCAVVMFGDRGQASGWGAFRMLDEKRASESRFDVACRIVTKSYSLTPRESEILALLARGRNKSFICDHCSISVDTAKSHMRNIYRKLGIHSQQELMSLVEQVESETAADKSVAEIPKTLL